MDDESRFHWSIAGGVSIGICLLMTWLYATWLVKAIVLTMATTFGILGRFYLFANDLERTKQRGNPKESRNLLIVIAAFTILILLLALQDFNWGPVRLR